MAARTGKPWRADPRSLRPMMATLVDWKDVPLTDARLSYERKFDGIRALIVVEPGKGDDGDHGNDGDHGGTVQILSRNGNDKTDQFPEIAAAARQIGGQAERPVVIDGEIVAVDGEGRALGFEALQPRMHLLGKRDIAQAQLRQPCRAFVFDLLRDGDEDLRGLTLRERRKRLESVMAGAQTSTLALAEVADGDGRALEEQARAEGWEGLIVKALDSRYVSESRSPDWRKLKLVHEQEFVVGGFTEARRGRVGFGALLVGVYEGNALVPAGGVGSGFDDRTLAALAERLKTMQVEQCPFAQVPATIETAHWVQPSLCVQVRFSEWTSAGSIRHPVFMGVLDDRDPRTIRREKPAEASEKAATAARTKTSARAPAGARAAKPFAPRKIEADWPQADGSIDALVAVLDDLERRKHKGRVRLADGRTLEFGNLDKIFWPALKKTKGDLLRHYARVSPYILPVVRDRPLVMKRYPDGIEKEAFYQHRAPDVVPDGVRVVSLPDDDVPSRLIGGDLCTLLYMAQLGTISQDPWFSRVDSPLTCDEVALDLDPMDGVPFSAVNDCARWIRDLLGKYDLAGFPKTSGASGLHIFLPLAPGTPYEAGRLFSQILATMIARQHPKVATVERKVEVRGQTVYIDYLQNIHGKTLACAYSARASDFAGASTPLTWDEVEAGVDPREFTIATMPARLAEVGDLWAGTRKPEYQINLASALQRLQGG